MQRMLSAKTPRIGRMQFVTIAELQPGANGALTAGRFRANFVYNVRLCNFMA
jgi:hypothetical protein